MQTNRIAEHQALEAMKQYGLTIHTPSDDEVAQWELEVKRMEPHLRGNVISEEIYDRVIKLTGDQ